MMKNLFVLHTKKTRPSAKALANNIVEMASDLCNVACGTVGTLLNTRPDTVINIGEARAALVRTNTPILNTPTAIARSSNKRWARILFGRNNIPSPMLWTAGVIPRDVYPLVGRTTNHAKGRGFWYCKNHLDAMEAHRKGATHFLKFIPNTKEFRIHVMTKGTGHTPEDYVVIKISEKVFENPHQSNTFDVIKNHDNGWVFKYAGQNNSKELLNSLRETSKKAVSLFELDWGAVDIMVSKDTQELYVLEINSSPCLTDTTSNTLDKYTDWVLKLAGVFENNSVLVDKAPLVNKPAQLAHEEIAILKTLFKRVFDSNKNKQHIA